MTDQLPWLARLLTAERQVVGAGMLVDARHVVTCAHVVNQALGRPLAEPAPPEHPVELDFVEAESGIVVRARSAWWVPIEKDERGDVCVLELDGAAPPGTRPAPLRLPAKVRGHRFDTYGFPRGFDMGVGSQGEIGRPAGPGREWVQLEATRTTGHRIERGFSGAPVWDDSAGGVVGMVVTDERDPQAKVAFMLPVRELVKRWPPLEALVRACQLYSADEELTTHWSPRARGLERDFERGWYFTGRHQVLTKLVGWLAAPGADGQVRVVTGDPGSGKSAVLARLVTLSDPHYRPRVPSLDPNDPAVPPVGVIDVAVFARRKTIGQVIAELARAAEVEANSVELLIERLGERGRPFAIVVDALDEASEPLELAGGLLRRLASDLASVGCKVLVGTRRSRHNALLRTLGAGAVIFSLDQLPWLASQDLATYVERRLLMTDDAAASTPYRGQERLAREVAQAVATRAYPLFLVAQLTSKGLVQRGAPIDPDALDWQARFPTTVADTLDWYLTERFGPAKSRVVELLTPLAYAQGEGLPRELWPTAAGALADRHYTLDDVQQLLDTAADYLIEQTEADGGPVYRLYHEALADALARPEDAQANQRTLTKALVRTAQTDSDGKPVWQRAHAYIRAYLPAHAAAGRELDQLLRDVRFLLAADPDGLLSALWAAAGDDAVRTAQVYRSAVGQIRGRPIGEAASYLELHAYQAHDAKLAERITAAGLTRPWSVSWTSWQPIHARQTIGRHEDAVVAVAVGQLGGRPVVISGSEDETLRVWDLELGVPVGPPWYGHEAPVSAVAVGELGGRPVVISGSEDQTLRVWDLERREPLGKPMRDHKASVVAVAVGELGGRPVVISGAVDGTLRVWDLERREPLGKPMRGHKDQVFAVAVGQLGGRPVVISGGRDETLRVWDLERREALGKPMPGGEYSIYAVAVGELDGRPVVVSGGFDEKVRVWDIGRRVLIGAPMRGHEGPIHAVAVGELGGRPVVISGSTDQTVRVWDLERGEQPGEPMHAHQRRVQAVAMGELNGRPVVVSGGWDQTLRVWDLEHGDPLGEPVHGHGELVGAVAVGELGGRPVVVSASDERIVRLWDLEDGDQLGELHGPGSMVISVAVGELSGRPVVISGAVDKTLWVWDLERREPLGEPMRGHEGTVIAVAVGQLGGRPVVISGSEDETLRVWDLELGVPVGPPWYGHEAPVSAVAVGELGGRPVVISGSTDQTVRVWDLAERTGYVIEVGSAVEAVTWYPSRELLVAGAAMGLVALQLHSQSA